MVSREISVKSDWKFTDDEHECLILIVCFVVVSIMNTNLPFMVDTDIKKPFIA